MNFESVDYRIDNKIALFLDGNRITGFTSIGGYDVDDPNTVLVDTEILPDGFFQERDINRFLYYSDPEEVVRDLNYESPQDKEEFEEIEEEQPQPQPEEQVTLEDYNKMKEELNELKTMMAKLLEQKE